mmetsp:Transcript_22239/g.58912  ORF Transcript_22239/g.58912 Transcript_22239/m.58912 type:complete len:203 (+) Transcript_22239:47-655(+)
MWQSVQLGHCKIHIRICIQFHSSLVFILGQTLKLAIVIQVLDRMDRDNVSRYTRWRRPEVFLPEVWIPRHRGLVVVSGELARILMVQVVTSHVVRIEHQRQTLRCRQVNHLGLHVLQGRVKPLVVEYTVFPGILSVIEESFIAVLSKHSTAQNFHRSLHQNPRCDCLSLVWVVPCQDLSQGASTEEGIKVHFHDPVEVVTDA